jgi:hypothetical protein
VRADRLALLSAVILATRQLFSHLFHHHADFRTWIVLGVFGGPLSLLLIDASPAIRLRRETDDKSLMEDRLEFLGGNGHYGRLVEEAASHKKFDGIEGVGICFV